ncbi:hypothetical protein MPTK1_2g23340 [Marchantia polymorpha subsp. ruderalis]|uniref:Uncharacterized protein n=1 Tax=Marchantia polymorpha TaxID=3197 RepID=A0A2R6VYU8_MARPO|nr:hypothetical protein MARPO_0376s0001 [Marchantia polymorpha]BBN03418.1 hypothetical protein Mp_2g23340 [Marchantia polymorpha subsp. ruderalis]|eukprot:PTQ26785.1 hypothetical protein MARPO_0376s0001 [Marchantia polymorpha]
MLPKQERSHLWRHPELDQDLLTCRSFEGKLLVTSSDRFTRHSQSKKRCLLVLPSFKLHLRSIPKDYILRERASLNHELLESPAHYNLDVHNLFREQKVLRILEM